MTHPSVNSIVERLQFDAARCELQFSKGVAANITEAATIISELQATVQRLTANPADQRYWEGRYRDEAAALSRIKAETIEALRPFADALQDVDDAAGDEWHLWESPAAMNLSVGDLRRANTAIRSLGSTGGAEKTAESGHSPSTHNSASE